MKIVSATLHPDTPPITSTRLFNVEKGHELSFEAGMLVIRGGGQPKTFLVPAAQVAHMVGEDETPKKK